MTFNFRKTRLLHEIVLLTASLQSFGMSNESTKEEDSREVERLLEELKGEPSGIGKALTVQALIARMSYRHETILEKQTNSLIRWGKLSAIGTVVLATATFVLAYVSYIK